MLAKHFNNKHGEADTQYRRLNRAYYFGQAYVTNIDDDFSEFRHLINNFQLSVITNICVEKQCPL